MQRYLWVRRWIFPHANWQSGGANTWTPRSCRRNNLHGSVYGITQIFAAEAEQIKAGEEVVLIYRQADVMITADELALQLGTIHYEVICMLAHRVPRVYISEGTLPKLVNALLTN